MKRKIGITQRVDRVDLYDESRDALDNRLIEWVLNADLIPIPIPNNLVDDKLPNNLQSNLDKWLDDVGIDVVLLSGGNNIGDVQLRDLTEEYLVFWAEKYKKPLLGICRGMQMMGICAGAQLVQINGHTKVRHKLKVKDTNNKALPKSVNSYHDFALEKCPEGYEILAESEDGSIEAIKHKKLHWEGWMWHPERELPYNDIDRMRLKKMINNVK